MFLALAPDDTDQVYPKMGIALTTLTLGNASIYVFSQTYQVSSLMVTNSETWFWKTGSIQRELHERAPLSIRTDTNPSHAHVVPKYSDQSLAAKDDWQTKIHIPTNHATSYSFTAHYWYWDAGQLKKASTPMQGNLTLYCPSKEIQRVFWSYETNQNLDGVPAGLWRFTNINVLNSPISSDRVSVYNGGFPLNNDAAIA